MMRTVLTLFFLSPLFLWCLQTGNPAIYFTDQVPPGQLPYVLSKLVGLYALLVIAWQIIASLTERLYRQGLLISSVKWFGLSHKRTGIVIIVLALAHLLLFMIAVSLRQGYPAWSLLLLDFKDYYHTRLSLGLLGFFVLLLVAVAGRLRERLGSNLSRYIHKSYIFALVLIYCHSLAVGSDSQTLMGLFFYYGLALCIAVLVLINILWPFRARLSHYE